MLGQGLGAHREGPPLVAVAERVFAIVELARGQVGRSLDATGTIDPTLGKDTFAIDHPILEDELAEAAIVAQGRAQPLLPISCPAGDSSCQKPSLSMPIRAQIRSDR